MRRVCANAGTTRPQKFYRGKFRRLQSSSTLMCARTRQHTLTGFRDVYTYVYTSYLPSNRFKYILYYIVREGESFLAYYIHALVRVPSISRSLSFHLISSHTLSHSVTRKFSVIITHVRRQRRRRRRYRYNFRIYYMREHERVIHETR